MMRLLPRVMVKVDLIMYFVPIPVLVYFVLFAFPYAQADPQLFLIAIGAVLIIALAGATLTHRLLLRRMIEAMREDFSFEPVPLRRAAIAAYILPLAESLAMFLRWVVPVGLCITLPYALMGRIGVIEIVSNTVFTGMTGIVSIPLVYLVCEGESLRFFEYLREKGVRINFRNPIRIGITARLVITLLFTISYPLGLLLYTIYMSNIGYLDLRTIPIGFGLLVFCSALMSVLVAVLFSRSFGSIFRGMNKNLEGVSRGDLTVDVTVRDGDEIGELARHYKSVIDTLGSSVHSVRDSARVLGKWVEEISSASKALAEASAHQESNTRSVQGNVEAFSASLKAMSDRIITHAQTVSESAAAVEELSAGVASIARGAGAVRGTVSENVTSIGKGREKIQSAIDEALRMNDSLARMSSTVRDIGGRFQQVGEALLAVQDIAGQTNILAMNAAIEAAHAGDAGRGFAIVAAEVRRLAERTTEFVKAINAVMEDIGLQIEAANTIAEAGDETSRVGRSAAEEAQAAVEGIMRSIERIDAMVEEISRTTGEQAKAATDAITGMEALREFSRSVGDELGGQMASAQAITDSIKAIGVNTEKNTKASHVLSELAASLRSKSEELSVTVSRFRLREEDGDDGKEG
jgi:methyl-accepting chemotaxis protein